MKKIGKYEKRSEGVAEKQPKMQSVLLQTYFTSLLSLVLCVTMFFGTSYAWFTSEVSNAGNEIYVGTLKVGLYAAGEGGDVDLSKPENKLFDGNIRWEPGYTALETIKVVNEGDLAFKYTMNFTSDDADVEAVAQNFEVWVFNHYNQTYNVPASYGDVNETNGWISVGTLADVLNGTAVLKDKVMETVRISDFNPAEPVPTEPADPENEDIVKTVDTYTIALHMRKETSDASIMGKKITLNVKLVAYQMASEEDSFGNHHYDSDPAVATDAASLQSALRSGGNTQLITDVKIGSEGNCVTMNGGTLYGNAKTITYSGNRNANGNSVGVLTTTGGTINNLKIDGGENGRALYITELTSDLFVSDCTFSGAYSFNLSSTVKTEYTLNFANSTFESWTSYANVVKCANFTDCTFEAELKPYGDTTLTDCKFTTAGLDVSELKAGESITLTNCVYQGATIESATITATAKEDGTVAVVCDNDLLVISGDYVVPQG